MLFSRRPKGQDERDAMQGVNQDGFAVPLGDAVRRPWHEDDSHLAILEDIAAMRMPTGEASVPDYLRRGAAVQAQQGTQAQPAPQTPHMQPAQTQPVPQQPAQQQPTPQMQPVPQMQPAQQVQPAPMQPAPQMQPVPQAQPVSQQPMPMQPAPQSVEPPQGAPGAAPWPQGPDAAQRVTPYAQSPAAFAQQPAQAAPRSRASARSAAAYATVGRRVLDLADNGDGTLTVARCLDPDADDLDIQFEAGACPVTAIAPRAFSGCAALRRVALPDSLRQIGEMAFSGCAHLTRVVIPGGVQRVGTLAFAKCASLARVRIEPGVQALGPSCFQKCTSLARVDIPESVKSFGGGVFFGCGKQLCLHGPAGSEAETYAALNGVAYDSESWREDEHLRFEENEDGTLVVIGPRAKTPERIEIPTEVCGRRIVAIAPRAFFACGSLTHLSVGGGVRTIGESAFFGCRSLGVVAFERGLEAVGENAFAGCEGIPQITLPWGTARVGRMAFFGCTRLSFVKMPATTRVEDFAFDGCAPGIRIFGGVSAGRTQQRFMQQG